MEYKQAWKVLVTPAGFTLLAHTASARRTSGSGCTGWPSPAEQNASGGIAPKPDPSNHFTLQTAAVPAGWPTATVNDATGSEYTYARGNHDKPVLKLPGAAKLSGGPTPNVPTRGLDLQTTAAMAGWSTPAARDEKGIDQNYHDGAVNNSLPNQVASLAGWETPKAVTSARSEEFRKGRTSLNVEEALLGPTPSSSPAATERRGVLNPAFPLWLMGFPAHWQRSCPGWQSWDTNQRLLQGC